MGIKIKVGQLYFFNGYSCPFYQNNTYPNYRYIKTKEVFLIVGLPIEDTRPNEYAFYLILTTDGLFGKIYTTEDQVKKLDKRSKLAQQGT